MYIPFEEMPGHSRIWVYTCNRPLTANEAQMIGERLTEFCMQWAAHGHPMKSSSLISHQHFILLAADEQSTAASGCSIDSSTRVFTELGRSFGVDFFDRSVAFFIGNEVKLIPLRNIGESFKTCQLNEKTLTFPQQAATKDEWIQGPVPAVATWLKRYLPAIDERAKIQP